MRPVACSVHHEDANAWISKGRNKDFPSGLIEIVWTGQAGFLFKSKNLFIGIDLYLSDSLAEKYRGTLFPHERLIQVPCDPGSLSALDVLLSTHGHTDHMDVGTLKSIYKDKQGQVPLFVCPRAEIHKAHERYVPLQRVCGINAGETFIVNNRQLSITALPAAHETLKTDAFGNNLFLGYIMEFEGVRIFHSGDGIPYDGLVDSLQSMKIDIALMPVNGRDEYRASHGVPGNFTIDEALDICNEANIPLLMPHHHGMFDFNTISIAEIEAALEKTHRSGVDVIIPSINDVCTCMLERAQ